MGPPIDGSDRPRRPGARHDQLTNATLAAWFGTQNCYLAMAAMRRDTPRVEPLTAGAGVFSPDFFCPRTSAARNSPACKGKSLRCLRKCRFLYIDTSPALSARRHLTAALRYSARPPQRPSRSRPGRPNHQTYCLPTSSEPPPPWVACCAHQVQSFDLSQTFWCRGLWGLGFNEQIFGADEQNPGRGQSD